MHGHAAEDVGVYLRDSPEADEQIDHAGGGGAGGAQRVCIGLDDDPGIGGYGTRRLSRFDERAVQLMVVMQMKAKYGVKRALYPIDADFAVSLGGMTVAAGEERAGIGDREIKASADAKLTNVHVAAERAGRASAEFAFDGGSDAHHAAEGAKRNDGRSERTSFMWKQIPMKEKWLAETFFEEAEAFDDG